MYEVWASDLAPLIFVAGFTVFGVLCYPLVRGIQRRLEGGRGADHADAERVRALEGEVAALRSQLDAGADVSQRVLELEERLDFAERVLAQRVEPPRIGQER
jgi:hypothetical protein